jgi:anti-sigma B factor antagonist
MAGTGRRGEGEVALSIDQLERQRGVVLVVTGDLDMVTAPELVGTALATNELEPRHLVIDASGIDFCDSSGLAAFVRIGNQLSSDGHRLGIAAARPMVRRILEMSGLHEAFVVTDTVDEVWTQLATTDG